MNFEGMSDEEILKTFPWHRDVSYYTSKNRRLYTRAEAIQHLSYDKLAEYINYVKHHALLSKSIKEYVSLYYKDDLISMADLSRLVYGSYWDYLYKDCDFGSIYAELFHEFYVKRFPDGEVTFGDKDFEVSEIRNIVRL